MLPVWTKCLFCGWAPVARLEFILGPMANQTLPLDRGGHDDRLGRRATRSCSPTPRSRASTRAFARSTANYELADLGSTNGVYVNGHKVPKKTLEPGDIIRVGNTEAVFKRE